MVQIIDGRTGYVAEVSAENRLKTTAVAVPSDQHLNEEHQKYFSLPFEGIDPSGADDYFFYIKNTGNRNLHVTDIRVMSTVVGSMEVHHVTGTPSYSSDTDVVPVNRYVGTTNTISAITKTDTNTTGITNAGTIFYQRLDTANKQEHLRTSSHIIIPPGQSIALLWDTSTGVLSGIVSIYEQQADI